MEQRTKILLASGLGVTAILMVAIALALYYSKKTSTTAATPATTTSPSSSTNTTTPATSTITNPVSYAAVTNPSSTTSSGTTTTATTTNTSNTSQPAPYAFTGKYKNQDNVVMVKDNDYTCRSQAKNTGGSTKCILPLAEAEALCSSDNACTGYGQALSDPAWMAANNNGFQLASALKGNWDHNWISYTKSTTIPVDAEIGAWSKWTDCVNSTQSETRPCIQDGKNGGITCASSTLTNTRDCVMPVTQVGYIYQNQVVPSTNSFTCASNSKNVGGATNCILPLDEAIAVCTKDPTCKGYGAAIHNNAWSSSFPNMFQVFNSDKYVANNDWEMFSKTTLANTTIPDPTPTSFVCHTASDPYRWIIHGPSSDTSNMYGWTGGFVIKGFKNPAPHTTKYIVKYAMNPTRMLFYKSEDETTNPGGPMFGFGASDPNWGSGLVIYLYPFPQPNTTKYYYQYARSAGFSTTVRTCISTSDQSNAGWNYNYDSIQAGIGSGGVFYAPN